MQSYYYICSHSTLWLITEHCLCAASVGWHERSPKNYIMACLGCCFALNCGLKLRISLLSWDFMVADNSSSMFSARPWRAPAVMLYFLFLDLRATFPSIKSELVMLGNVIHFTKSCIVWTLEFIHWAYLASTNPPKKVEMFLASGGSGSSSSSRGAVLGAELAGDLRAGNLPSLLRLCCCNTQ